MMESVVIVLFVAGCVAAGFAIYRVRRGGGAMKPPAVVLKEAAGLTETVRRLYAIETAAEETAPDANRISTTQRDYVRTHVDEFVSLHRDEMERMVSDALARFRTKSESAGELSEEELEKAEKSIRVIMANRFAKAWCELRGVT